MTDTATTIPLKPIDTAPKDGTKIVLYHECWDMFPIGYWEIIVEEDCDGTNGQIGWVVPEGFPTAHDDCFLWPEEDWMPTHWMPIPTLSEGE